MIPCIFLILLSLDKPRMFWVAVTDSGFPSKGNLPYRPTRVTTKLEMTFLWSTASRKKLDNSTGIRSTFSISQNPILQLSIF